MILYKLTHANDTTYGGMTWGEGVEHTAPGGGELCTSVWLHAYRDPILAVIMDPHHGAFGSYAHLWECDGDIGIDDRTKVGCTRIRTLRLIDLPEVTIEQRIRFAIFAAREVYDDPAWLAWSDHWLSGVDRCKVEAATAAARAAAAEAARAAARAADKNPIDLVAIAHRAMEVTEHDGEM